jgi:hypothetical protein
VSINNILVWILEVWLAFIRECDLVHDDMEGFFLFQNASWKISVNKKNIYLSGDWDSIPAKGSDSFLHNYAQPGFRAY